MPGKFFILYCVSDTFCLLTTSHVERIWGLLTHSLCCASVNPPFLLAATLQWRYLGDCRLLGARSATLKSIWTLYSIAALVLLPVPVLYLIAYYLGGTEYSSGCRWDLPVSLCPDRQCSVLAYSDVVLVYYQVYYCITLVPIITVRFVSTQHRSCLHCCTISAGPSLIYIGRG